MSPRIAVEAPALLDALPECALLVDAEGEILAANQAFAAFVGDAAATLTGRRLDELALTRPEETAAYLRRAAGPRRPLRGTIRICGGDGKSLDFRSDGAVPGTASPILLRGFRRRDAAASGGPDSGSLDNSERNFRLLVDGASDYAIFMLDPTGVISTWNLGAERIKGYGADEIVGRHFSVFYTPEDQLAGLADTALRTARQAGKFETEGWRIRKNGKRFWASVVIDAIRDETGQLIGFAKITRDLTERRATEEMLRQSLKMEAVGQLTGGVAHDFNNLLVVIGGNIETVQRRLPSQLADLHRLTQAALRGVERAAVLTHRLLAFSRRQPLDPKPVQMNRLIIGMSDLLGRTLGEHIKIETVLSAGLWRVSADPNQLENAVLNLCVNARDAMPNGGKLTVETANMYLDETYAAYNKDAGIGEYVMVAVTDTGSGIPREVIDRVFEPFFTTKRLGEGTGLGLSQVYGFVRQSGGHVKIYSEPGDGTTVRFYLPRFAATETDADTRNRPGAAPAAQHRETILVVEDDPDVRANSTGILRELGYDILEAGESDAALGLLVDHPEIDLLFTDVGLPGAFNGRQLADEALKRRPALKILFTTGYARNAIVHHGRLDPGVSLIVKPFTFADLAGKIRCVLDGMV